MIQAKDVNDDFEWLGSQILTKGQETKLKIIKSSIRLFSEYGFANVTLQDIASVTATSHPLILKHFGSKNNLLLAVRKFVSASNHKWVDSKIQPNMNARECILTHSMENLKWAVANQDEAKIVMLTYYHSSLISKRQNPGENAQNLGTRRILKYVQQAEREGLILGEETPVFIAEMIHEYLIGLSIRLMISSSPTTKTLAPSYKKKVEFFLESFLKKPKKSFK